MSFIWPPMLLSLALIPIGLLLFRFMDLRRRRRLAAYGGFGVAQGTAGRPGRIRSRIPAALLLLGLTAMLFALSRPQAVVSLPREEGTVILAFDISASMAATDLAPSRIEAAKVAAKDFVARQPVSIEIGVVAFSDSGISVQSPTNDRATVVSAIDRLTPQRGTSVAGGIAASLKAIAIAEAGPYANNYYSNRSADPSPTATPTPMPSGLHAPAVIILLSDGENNEQPDPAVAAQAAADQGVRIFTVGIGSTAGADVSINGFQVHTQLDEAMLQSIAQTTGGTYYNATDAAKLLSIYDTIDTAVVLQPQLTEITALLAGVSILMLLAGAVTSLVWLGRMP
jgi:Ca-activated chloride channel family protein